MSCVTHLAHAPQYAAATQYVLDNADTVNNVNIAIYYWEGANPEIISQNYVDY